MINSLKLRAPCATGLSMSHLSLLFPLSWGCAPQNRLPWDFSQPLLGSSPFVTPRASHFLPLNNHSSLSLNYPCSLFFPHRQHLCAHSCSLPGGGCSSCYPSAVVKVGTAHPSPTLSRSNTCTGGTMPRKPPTTPQALANLGAGTAKRRSPWEKLWMCSSAQAAVGRQQGAQGSGWGKLEGKHQARDLTQCGEHLPVQGRGCSLQPFGSVGFGLPSHVDVCKEGTSSCDMAHPQPPSPVPGHRAGMGAHSPAREK